MSEMGIKHPDTVMTMVRGVFSLDNLTKLTTIVGIAPIMSTHGEVSTDCEDTLHHEHAAHVDVEGEGEYLAPNSIFMKESAKS